MLNVEVAYACEQQQVLLSLEVAEGCTVEQAIQQSEILKKFPEINLSQQPVGIFSRKVKLTTELNDGDRIEIYRDLQCDPKQRRRNKAKT